MDKQTFSGVSDYNAEGPLSARPPACLNTVGAPFLQTDVMPNQAFQCMRTGPAEADFAWVNITGGSAAAPGSIETIRFPVGLVTTSSATLVPAGALVLSASLSVTTPYTVAATIEIGQAAAPSAFMTTAENDPQVAGIYQNPQDTTANSPGQAVLVTVAGAPAVGAAEVTIQYVGAPQS